MGIYNVNMHDYYINPWYEQNFILDVPLQFPLGFLAREMEEEEDTFF
jgi:hypothetical protein